MPQALPIPDWFTLDADAIASDSRLQGHYLNPTTTDDQFLAKIEAAIPIACAFVAPKLRPATAPYQFPFSLGQLTTAYPNETDDQRQERIDGHKVLASEAAKERVFYDLYRLMDGQDYLNKARECENAANDLIAALVSELTETRAAIQEAGKPNLTGYGNLSMGRGPASWTYPTNYTTYRDWDTCSDDY